MAWEWSARDRLIDQSGMAAVMMCVCLYEAWLTLTPFPRLRASRVRRMVGQYR